jgi:hypothetical protein
MPHNGRASGLPAKRSTRPAINVVICASAASAGIHAGLVPEHLREARPLGVSFIVAVVLLLAAGAGLAIRPEDRRAAQVVALLLAGLIVSWGASRITGIPFLQPRPESVDVVGLVTKLIEALGLVFALWLSQPVGGRRSSAIQEVSR